MGGDPSSMCRVHLIQAIRVRRDAAYDNAPRWFLILHESPSKETEQPDLAVWLIDTMVLPMSGACRASVSRTEVEDLPFGTSC